MWHRHTSGRRMLVVVLLYSDVSTAGLVIESCIVYPIIASSRQVVYPTFVACSLDVLHRVQ